MYMQQATEYDVTNISGLQPRKNMTMGKVNTSLFTNLLDYQENIPLHPTNTSLSYSFYEFCHRGNTRYVLLVYLIP